MDGEAVHRGDCPGHEEKRAEAARCHKAGRGGRARSNYCDRRPAESSKGIAKDGRIAVEISTIATNCTNEKHKRMMARNPAF